MYVFIRTPHSASLHVGLKSLAPSGHLRNTTFPLHSPHINPAFPHSAVLHVELKFLALSGLLRRIGTIVQRELRQFLNA
ncbi:hypothetical protein Barb4_00820 [Bacteroidales bacterium Barb4]|nr:hypothetical protein Barb4_00820 [Bacteroidales bacterium Barb4]